MLHFLNSFRRGSCAEISCIAADDEQLLADDDESVMYVELGFGSGDAIQVSGSFSQ